MPFSGADPSELRALARHMEHEVAPVLRRNAAMVLDVLERQDRRTEADRAAYALGTLAAWSEDAAFDLRRRATLVADAQHLTLWASGMPAMVQLSVESRATAVVDGTYTGDAMVDIAHHHTRLASLEAARLSSSFRRAIDDGDASHVALIAGRLEEATDEPWFGEMAARLFSTLGPIDTARLIAVLFSVPRQEHDESTLLTLAAAFSTATARLDWSPDDVALWLDQGETGVVQLLRTGPVDPAFLSLVVQASGWIDRGRGSGRGDPGLRRLLAPGTDVWSRVGTDAGDHRAVLLDALGHHLGLAISLLDEPETMATLLTSPWRVDEAGALGRLMERIDAEGETIDSLATDRIRRSLLIHAADPAAPMPAGLRPALGAVAARHMADLAFSLAVTGPVVESASRAGIELDPSGVRRIIRLVAPDDAAFNRLLAGYGNFVASSLGSGAAGGADRLTAVADELGAVTFALAYVDREVRVERAGEAASDRLSPLRVLGFLASAGTALLPGPLDKGAGHVVDRLLVDVANDELVEAERSALTTHNAWKEGMLDELEYLAALDMARHGLLDLDPELSRTEFLYRLEEMDGLLERIMAIVEAQARRQREAVAEGS